MDFSFDSVKVLYDTYGIQKENDKYVIVDRRNQNKFDFESDFAKNVMFAHSWVLSTKYNHSTTGGNSITEEEYIRAFDENSRQTYSAILSTIVQGLKSFNRMYKLDVIEKEIKESVGYVHACDIVRGLYSSPKGYESLEHWCRQASLLYSEEQLLDINNNGVSR